MQGNTVLQCSFNFLQKKRRSTSVGETLGRGKSGKYKKGSKHTSVHTAFAAATEEQWEPTPHTMHTSTKAGFRDGESAAYEAFCKKTLAVFWQSSGYHVCKWQSPMEVVLPLHKRAYLSIVLILGS